MEKESANGQMEKHTKEIGATMLRMVRVFTLGLMVECIMENTVQTRNMDGESIDGLTEEFISETGITEIKTQTEFTYCQMERSEEESSRMDRWDLTFN